MLGKGDISVSQTSIFDPLTLKFDQLFRNFNLGHKFLTWGGRPSPGYHMLHVHSLLQDLLRHPIFFYLVTLSLKFDLLKKTSTLAIAS